MKRVLVLGAGLYFKKTLEEVKKGGYYVIGVDRNPDAEGKVVADEFFPVDIVDQEAVLALARDKGIHGIMNLNEFGSRTASYVARALGLNHHEEQTVEATNDKGLMRDVWAAAALSMPRYRYFTNEADVFQHIQYVGYPAILKPADSGGSGRGISVVRSESDLQWAVDFARSYARNGRFILEQFIEGTELTIESFSINGRAHILAMSDKVKPDLRTRVATSLNYPALLADDVREKVEELVRAAVMALGIKNGVGHTEVIVTAGGQPFLVETAARGGGGHIFHTIIEAVSGINAPVLQAKWLTNDMLEIGKIGSNGCCYRFFNPPHGILKAVKNIEAATRIPGVVDLGIAKKPGDEVGNLENSLHRAGFVVTAGKGRQEAIDVADKVEKTIVFEVEPVSASNLEQ
jgi:biotin carboxylase